MLELDKKSIKVNMYKPDNKYESKIDKSQDILFRQKLIKNE
jgi:hypothetical protein